MKRIRVAKNVCITLAICATTAIASFAQTFTSLASFGGNNGAKPYAALIQYNGNLYGTTNSGGANGQGEVFEITPSGTLSVIYSFCAQPGCTDGAGPDDSLLVGSDGNFYGTTVNGGGNAGCGVNTGCGTVFQLTPAGVLTTLYAFCAQASCADGWGPYSALVQGTDGNFYGTTANGGTGPCGGGCGTVFRLTPTGVLSTLHNFVATDGEFPYGGLVQASNGIFYGTTNSGGGGVGTIYSITSTGTQATLVNFNTSDGAYPSTAMIQGTDGNLYGVTTGGGAGSLGTVFKMTPGGVLTSLYSFISSSASPTGVLVEGTDGNFYGTTVLGGANGDGSVFEITPSGTLTTLYSFCSVSRCGDGLSPDAGLVLATNGTFYGTTSSGGNYQDGTVFSLSTGLGAFVEITPTSGQAGTQVTIQGMNLSGATAVSFNGTAATFTVVSSSEITTTAPANLISGPVTVTTPTGTLTSDVPFLVPPSITSISPTSGPPGMVVTISGSALTGATSVTFGGVAATSFDVINYSEIASKVPAEAASGPISVITPGGTAVSSTNFTLTGNTYSVVAGFTSSFGSDAPLVQGPDGNLYGTTLLGGTAFQGSVFKLTPTGTLTTLASLTGPNASAPNAALVLDSDGDFYGTDSGESLGGPGTAFEITPQGAMTTLYTFCQLQGCDDGAGPWDLVLGSNGNFYGVTTLGGYTSSGTIFELTPAGVLTTLYVFCLQSGCPDGAYPSALVLGRDGNFYGTTKSDGTGNCGGLIYCGTVFKITPEGNFTTLHSFCSQSNCADGDYPTRWPLVQASNGNLYGTTESGGANDDGTVFEITPAGDFTTVLSGTSSLATNPMSLILGNDGNLYGIASAGNGSIFKIVISGTRYSVTNLHNFCQQTACLDGQYPLAPLMQATNGTFYGTTEVGGSEGDGVVFSLTTGLSSLVAAEPTFGQEGATIIILGTNLTGASSVAFNGTPAVFDVVSPTEITATVPANATTGTVEVTLPGGTLSTAVPFQVTPIVSSFSPTSGPPGTDVTITGTSLAGATSVSFGGVATTVLQVKSSTEILASVPDGAISGNISVTTAGGAGVSAGVFSVSASSVSTLASFNESTEGALPEYGALVQGTDGNFYGTTVAGGGNKNGGTVFKVTPAGAVTTVYSFCSQPGCVDGEAPFAGLMLAANGYFYGTTSEFGNGTQNAGTLFELTPVGELTTLYYFCSQSNCADGAAPRTGVIQASNGDFYGTTSAGGTANYGTIYEWNSKTDAFTSLLSATNSLATNPNGLIQGADGNFYGTSSAGGTNNAGTVFKLVQRGTQVQLTTIYSFCSQTNCADGKYPKAALVQSSNGNFYGAASAGGADGYGTVFEITSAGKLTTLVSFDGADGQGPGQAALIQGTDGNFYGTTPAGGAFGEGTIFQMTPSGTLTTIYSFCSQGSCDDGSTPLAGLMQATNGSFYGTTNVGGEFNTGAVFSYASGLSPFAEMVPNSGIVGTPVMILGTNLASTTGVTFGETAAELNIVSSSEILTAVPAGATTGTVTVDIPGGNLVGDVGFRVVPQVLSFTPTSGDPGTVVTITGVSLTQTGAVTFGGVAATTFAANSDTEVTATVPAGAVTGKIVITTPGGTATSAASFEVTP